MENEININSGKKYDDDILNQSYEDIYSINEKKNAIEKLDDGGIYQDCGLSGDVKLAVNKNGEKIGIAKYSKNEAPTKNCLNYAFLASCGERTPQILDKRKGVAVFSVDEEQEEQEGEEQKVDFEVQKFFQHDGENNYFSPNVNEAGLFVPYKGKDYDNRKLYGFMVEDRTKTVIIKRSQYFFSRADRDVSKSLAGYGPYLYMWHILTECNDEFKTEFIDHFATLFADELCFDIQDRNDGNILVIPSKNGNGKDIVNLDIDFGWQKEISSRFYLEFYLIAKEVTFQFSETLKESYMNGNVNKNLNNEYRKRGQKVNFNFKQGQELKISPQAIEKLDTKIIEKIEQRLNFRKDKFVQYYIDNCIRRGGIDTRDAFTDFQSFMKSLYEYLKKQAELLKTNKDFGHFSKPFNDFMRRCPNYENFNNLSEEEFNKKWAERQKALENPKKMEEKKVNKGKIKDKNSSILFDNNNIFKKLEEEAIGDPNSIFYKENQKKNENGSINKNNEDEENEIINDNKKYEKEKIINDNKIENSIIEDKSNKAEKELKNSKEIEEQKVNSQVYPSYPASEQMFTTIEAQIIDSNNNSEKKLENEDKSKIKNENEYETKDNNKTNGTYLMKLILIILGFLLVSGGIALFLTASALALKFLAIGLGVLGAVGFGVGILYNKIIEHYRKESGSCCFRFWTYTIFEPKEKNKENDINLENQENNMIKDK